MYDALREQHLASTSRTQFAGAIFRSISNEDCLILNIWAPKVRPGPMPVLVWLHGGGFCGRLLSRSLA